jgi:TPR repeat protein
MGKAHLPTDIPSPASRPSADALFRMGLRLSSRAGDTAPNPVAAHALFEVAARLGSLEAKVYRRELGDEMDPADVDEARKIARDWLLADA